MPDGLKYNEITTKWLEGQGFAVTAEDKLGLEKNQEKPDFLCEKNGQKFWVEVKAVSLPERIKFQRWCLDEFKSREAKIKVPGRVFIKVADKTSEKDIKISLRMVDRVLSDEILSPVEDARHYVVVPKDPVPDYNEFVQIEYETNDGKEVLHSIKSLSEKYSRMYLGRDLRLDTKVKISYSTGEQSEGNRFGLGLFDDSNCRISIQLMNAESKFRICSLGHTRGAEYSRNIEIIRASSSKARDQFKSANEKIEENPGVLVFHHDNLFASDDETFVSAFYGDRTYEFSVDDGEEGLFFLGRNGFWTENQNTTVSAAMYFRKEDRPIIIYNRWAGNPLLHGLLDCKEYIPEDNGSFIVRE